MGFVGDDQKPVLQLGLQPFGARSQISELFPRSQIQCNRPVTIQRPFCDVRACNSPSVNLNI